MPLTPTSLMNATAIGTAQQPQKPSGQLGKDDFLKLLVGQLRHQDPMEPLKDQEFMGQMAQFSQLEQMTNVASSLQADRAFMLIGREVAYNDDKTGALVTGVVDKVVIEGGTPTLTVGGKPGIKTDAVREVK
jgi:flagellar basal-body rod modification protein FlgD